MITTLDGRIVAITGAGSGIGRELAISTARRGGHAAISDVDEDGLATTVRLADAAGPGRVLSTVVDVTDRAAVDAWAAEVVDEFDRVMVEDRRCVVLVVPERCYSNPG